MGGQIMLYIGDRPVLSSLQFALPLDGIAVVEGGERPEPAASCLVIDQAWTGNGFEFLGTLRAAGCTAPAILLVTNPTANQRIAADALGAAIVEKPLDGDSLILALRRVLEDRVGAA